MMNENRSPQTYNVQYGKIIDVQQPAVRAEEITEFARNLAMAAVKARRSCLPASTQNPDIQLSEDDSTYQAWFRYFMQLQLQDSQIRSELVQRNNNFNTITGIPTGTTQISLDQMNPFGYSPQPGTSAVSPLVAPWTVSEQPSKQSQNTLNPVRYETVLNPTDLARCRISESACGSTASPLTAEFITQLLQSSLMKQSVQDQRLIQQLLQQNYASQLTESAGRLSAEAIHQFSVLNPRLDCGSTSSLPSCLSMNFAPQQSGEKSASISPNQLTNSLYCTEISLGSQEGSIISTDFNRGQPDRISPAETGGGNSAGIEAVNSQSRTESSSCQTNSPQQKLSLPTTTTVYEESDQCFYSPVSSSFISVTEQEQSVQQPSTPQDEKHYWLRPRLRTNNRDRFLVRVIRVTYQCSCRANPDQTKSVDHKKVLGCQSKDCKTKEPKTYVTFQAQLPSISLSMRSSISGVSLSPATGLRLGFTCSLSSQGPALQDFASSKVAERLDAWEQAGNLPGFRCQVLSALHDTVGMMLQRIRDEGVHAIKLDMDYVFYPPAKELRPAVPRRRQLSSSSDSSITRMATRHRLSTVPTDVLNVSIQQASQSPRFDREIANSSGSPGQAVWSELFSCYEPSDSSRRPRTWHQVPEAVDQSSSQQDPVVSSDSQQSVSQSLAQNGMSHLSAPDVNRRLIRCLTPSPLRHEQAPTEKFNSLQYASETWSNTDSVYLQSMNANNMNRRAPLSPETASSQKPSMVANALFAQQQLLHMEASAQSVPTSPNRFIRTPRFSKLQVETTRLEPPPPPPMMKLSTSYKTVLNSTSAEGLAVRKKTLSPTAECNYLTRNDNSTEYGGRQTPLDNIVQEIITRLQNNPQLPLVVMPTNRSMTSSASAQLPTSDSSSRSSPAPLIFQLPHPDSAFVCLPASSDQMPRVVTAPKSGTLVVIPASPISSDELKTPPMQVQQQPLVLTGPKAGYFLMITSENRFEYVPINYQPEHKP